MANANVVTKQDRVLEALRNNDKGLTAAQIENQYKVGNARATVSSLRMKGFAIFANQHTDTKGRTKTFYRLGTPPRSVIAAGYRALAAQAA
jgi:predicted ArsR family transcriptional regulator